MKKPVIFVLFSILFFSSRINAQFYADGALPDTTHMLSSKPKFGLRYNGLAFFKNNEYFHPLVEGYTLPGFHIQPRLYCDLDDKFSLEAGVHLSQFSGKKGLNSVDPLFRATYSPTQSFSILLGWLKGTTSHQLIEPLYQWEKIYTQPLEYGVQFLVNKPGFKLDTWIDWERYIEFNDDFQEELTFGTTTKTLVYKNGDLECWVPVQATIKHKGGQVVAIDEPLTTLANYATGFNISLNRSGSLVKKLLFDFYYVGYKDFSPQKRLAYQHGYGFYPVVTANISAFKTSLGYWFAHGFISPKGEPLFQSVSAVNPDKVIPRRYLVTWKASYYKQIFKDVSFAAYFESYYDVNIPQMDYAYGISMAINGDILFK